MNFRSVQQQLFRLLQENAESIQLQKPGDADAGHLEQTAFHAALMVQVLQMHVCKLVVPLDQVTQLPIWEPTIVRNLYLLFNT